MFIQFYDLNRDKKVHLNPPFCLINPHALSLMFLRIRASFNIESLKQAMHLKTNIINIINI